MTRLYPPDRFELYQTDIEFALRPMIRPYGCYFMSIIAAMTAYFELPFTHEGVIKLYDAEMSDGDLQNESFVKSPQHIMDDIVGQHRVMFLGIRDATYVCKTNEIEFGCWHKEGKNYNHFTHTNGKGVTLYDPWGKDGSDSVRDGKLLSTRVVMFL